MTDCDFCDGKYIFEDVCPHCIKSKKKVKDTINSICSLMIHETNIDPEALQAFADALEKELEL